MPENIRPTLNPAEMAAELKRRITRLPYISAELPGIGGEIKAEPSHFVVEEQLPYAPCGEGEHVFITLQRSGWNTVDVAHALSRALKVPLADIGWGGRKDKQAVATQTFSVRLALEIPLTRIEADLASLSFNILSIKRHRHKLKTGHVAGNDFRIVLSGVGEQAFDRARQIAHVLYNRGIPNYFGPQRFGMNLCNLDRAVDLFHQRRPSRGRSQLFLVSVLQSALFNDWLSQRIADGYFNCMLNGDVAKKTDTGGLFIVEDEEEANLRFEKNKILYTGPMFGHKMKAAAQTAGQRESALLDRFKLQPSRFKPLRAPGTRRPGLIRLGDLSIKQVDQGLEFSFWLPAGAYATVVLREFMRSEGLEAPSLTDMTSTSSA